MSNTMNDDHRELYYKVSGKVEVVRYQRHMFEAEVEIDAVFDGRKHLLQGRGSAKSSFKALEKAIKNAGYLVGITC